MVISIMVILGITVIWSMRGYKDLIFNSNHTTIEYTINHVFNNKGGIRTRFGGVSAATFMEGAQTDLKLKAILSKYGNDVSVYSDGYGFAIKSARSRSGYPQVYFPFDTGGVRADTVVRSEDYDFGKTVVPIVYSGMKLTGEDGYYDSGEKIYIDSDNSNTVSPGDIRVLDTPIRKFIQLAGSVVKTNDMDVGKALHTLESSSGLMSFASPWKPGSPVYFRNGDTSDMITVNYIRLFNNNFFGIGD